MAIASVHVWPDRVDTTVKELESHEGHELQISRYGLPGITVNVTIECVTCGTVLVDFILEGESKGAGP